MKGPSRIQLADQAWQGRLPDWVLALVNECERTSLRKTAALLGLSPAMVSLAINNKRENLEFIKHKAEQKLMATIAACPVLGVIGINECLQEQAQPFSEANPVRIQLYRACRNDCPHYKGVL